MRLLGKMLNNAMMYNNIKASSNGVITIHNTDHDGYGFVSNHAAKVSEDTEFTLSQKDYRTLSTFKEMDINVKNNKITVKTKNGKITLANLIDVHTFVPSFDEVYSTNIFPKEFLIGEKFVGNDKIMVQLNGCNCNSDGYLITDNHCFFVWNKDTGLPVTENSEGKKQKTKICIPKECFKHIGNMTSCFTDESIIVFTNEEEGILYYTALNAVASPMLKLDFDDKVHVNFDKAELTYTLKMLKNYNKHIKIKLIDGKIHLISEEETNNLDITVWCEVVKGTKLSVMHNAEYLLKLIDLCKDSEITLMWSTKMCVYKNNQFIAGSMHYGQESQMEVE